MIMTKFLTGCIGAALITYCGVGAEQALAQTSSPLPAASPNYWLTGWQEPGTHWRLAVAPYAPHFRYSPEHRDPWALAVERQRPDGWLAGASYFSNSFGQPSGYLYVGKRWVGWFGREDLYTQLSGGLLYGYRGKYQSKVPFNHNGYSPGALASAGWQITRQLSLTAHAYGDAGVMFQLGWDLL